MKYLLLVHEDEASSPRQGDPRWQTLWDAYVQLDEDARAAGVLVDSQPLQASATARRVVMQRGHRSVEPGPVADGVRQLTGYYLVDVAAEVDALDWAARIPAASSGGIVEVRAVFEL